MVLLTIPQIADAWTRNGGAPAARVVMTAVALAESGGETTAIGPTDDWGLWQINGTHFEPGVLGPENVLDIDVNAREAISISSNGTNVAPWATCYADIASTGWYGYLATPEPGSAAYGYIPQVVAALAAASGSTAPGLPTTCQADDIGIPAGLVAGLQPGQSVYVQTCPGGSFDAGDLSPGYAVSWRVGGQSFVVTSANRGTMVPASTLVQVQRLTTVPGSGGLPGPSPTPSPAPTPPPNTLPAPVEPLPVGPAPTGDGITSTQTAWGTHAHYLNYGGPARLSRIANARTHLGDVLQ